MRRDVQKGICTFWTSFNLLFSICFFDNVKQVYHDLWAQSLLLAFACFLKSFSGIILLFQFWLGVRNVLQIKCQPNHCLDFIAVQRLEFYACKMIAHKSSSTKLKFWNRLKYWQIRYQCQFVSLFQVMVSSSPSSPSPAKEKTNMSRNFFVSSLPTMSICLAHRTHPNTAVGSPSEKNLSPKYSFLSLLSLL